MQSCKRYVYTQLVRDGLICSLRLTKEKVSLTDYTETSGKSILKKYLPRVSQADENEDCLRV